MQAKEPVPPSAHWFNKFWDIAVAGRIGGRGGSVHGVRNPNAIHSALLMKTAVNPPIRVEAVLARLQSKLDAKRKKLSR
jgi:hypothetical protein